MSLLRDDLPGMRACVCVRVGLRLMVSFIIISQMWLDYGSSW